MKLESLITLDAILRKGTFASAGEEVGLTTSAVSLQMKRLEEYLGQPLFDRSARTAKPNALARELAAAARSVHNTLEAARRRTKSTPLISGRVAVGTIRTVQATTLPHVLRDVASRYPLLAVKAVQGSSSELLSSLKAGALDAAVLIRPPGGGSTRLHWQDLESQSFVLIAPPDAPGATAAELVAKYPWIQYDTSLMGGSFAASFLKRHAPRKSATFELGSIEAIVVIVSAGLGVAVIPKPAHLSYAHPVRELRLKQERDTPTRRISFVCRAADREHRRILALSSAFVCSYRIRTTKR